MPLAICVVCLFLVPYVGFSSKFGAVLLIMATGGAAGAVYMAFESRRSSSKYDLRLLQKIHERKELEEIDIGEVSEQADRIICVHCGTDYSTRFPVCPHCGRST